MKRWYAGIMVVLFVALTTTVFAFGPKGAGSGCGGQGMGMGHGAGYANLNLTQEQQDKMWQAREKFRNDTSATRYEMFKKRAELKNLYADPNATDAAILAKQKEANALRQTMQDKMVQFKLAQRKILTPEQIKKISESGHGPGMGRGMGKGMGQGGGMGAGPCAQ
ncbi:MAG: periplasmic heavy metal sensor [Dehalococcoidia bacterium]|nr:MAG: periplasmic heavy metal sensor [Dehalococcoidia bacterium]